MKDFAVSGWTAVARSADIGRKPVRVLLRGRPLVLFRHDGALACLTDRCPHRSAPLSAGRVVAGGIECPYHGWQFDGSGRCRAMPALIGPLPRAFVPAHAVAERDGLVFAAFDKAPGEPYSTALSGQDTVATILKSRARSTLSEVAENILDATHTHFTHKGVLRGLSDKRYRVTVTVTGGDGWVEARYEGEPRQEGLVSRLLEGERSVSVGRFIAPGIAELEFWGKGGINLATTFHLQQETPDIVSGFGILSGPKQRGLGYLKAALFTPLFRIALAQDQRILRLASDNRAMFPEIQQMSTPTDVIRRHIDAILAGQRPSVADAPQTLVMEL